MTVTYQGTLVAIDRSSGRILWEHQLPGAVNGWMSISGDLMIIPVGGTRPPEFLALRLPG